VLESEGLRDQDVRVREVAEIAYEFVERIVVERLAIEKVGGVRILAPESDKVWTAIERKP
jgi:hypothetical protein